MKKTALALAASSLLLLSACGDDASSDGMNNGSGMGTGAGTLGTTKDGTQVGDRVFFELDSSSLTGEGQATLSNQATWLKEYGSVNVVIEGHADERGTREYNIALGERRATATKNYLTSLGVPASRISTISYGKERPAVQGSDEGSWSQNRRAVTVIAN